MGSRQRALSDGDLLESEEPLYVAGSKLIARFVAEGHASMVRSLRAARPAP